MGFHWKIQDSFTSSGNDGVPVRIHHVGAPLQSTMLYRAGRTSTYPEEPVESGIRFHFLGGAGEVGNVGCVIEDQSGTKVLMDYGLAPTKPPKYPSEAPSIDHAIITHSHIDHIGMAPWLVGHHGTTLHGSKLTSRLSEIMWRDTYKVSRIEGYPLAWDKRDLDAALEAWQEHDMGEQFSIGSWNAKFHVAGHIPGAVMTEMDVNRKKVLWTGDMDTRSSPNVSGALPVKCDILCLEGTYGGKYHPDRSEEEERFVKRVLDVVSRGGVAIIPAFASGRGQDVIRILHDAAPHLEVHYDGMGTRVTQTWMDCPELIHEPKSLRKAWHWCRRVRSKSDRKKALDADVIVTTSGMLDGGPAIWYVNRLRHNPANAILLTGYQAEGSGGRMLLDERKLPIYGKKTPVDLEVTQFSLSNHAGHKELVEFARACSPEHVIIFHAEREPAMALATDLEPDIKVHIPENGESIVIE